MPPLSQAVSDLSDSPWRLIAPYAVWMALMMALPATAEAYAVRTALTALALAVALRGVSWRPAAVRALRPSVFAPALAAGLAVFAIWTLPEGWAPYREWCVWGDADGAGPSPYDPAVCGSGLTLVRLAGSTFVIAVAEELFFRRWLLKFAGFAWMTALFAVEHDRWLAGAVAGLVYGVLALRKGLGAAIVAHAVTNFALGAYVIVGGHWAFW